MESKFKRFLKGLGPGILFASTAIGVSHLVQSTRAGALFGFGLLWAVILANLLKYPFFEYGSRYANVAGESIIDGYRRMGKWALWLYTIITAGSMFFVSSAVGAVTASFLDKLFGISASLGDMGSQVAIVALIVLTVAVLWMGQYGGLDRLIKIIGTVLLVSTITAVTILVIEGPKNDPFVFFSKEAIQLDSVHFGFLIALMGWMPTAIDLSAWNSLWTLERIKQTSYKPSVWETVRNFRISYIITAVLAPCLLLLGAYLLYGTNYEMPQNSADFANAIIGLYSETFGKWSSPVITASAFSIMLGTSIAVFDGYARSGERIIVLLRGKETDEGQDFHKIYKMLLLVMALGTFTITFLFSNALKTLVDVATSLSFVVAPVIAWINYRMVTAASFPADKRPGTGMRILSVAGIAFLGVFTIIYLIWLIQQ